MPVPHLEAQSLLGSAAGCCGNDCCSGRAGALLLGGKGAAGADESLKHPSFMQRSLQNYTHWGKDEIEKPHRQSGMVLKMFPSLTCLSSSQYQIRNQLCCRRSKVYWSLQGNAQSAELPNSQTVLTWLGSLWLEQDFCLLGEEIITSRSALGVPGSMNEVAWARHQTHLSNSNAELY